MSTRLRPIHDDGGQDICIAVHGLTAWGAYNGDKLERQVHEAELRGSVYLLHWSSSIVGIHTLWARDIRKEKAAQSAGISLARAIIRLPNAERRPITLIGHSQGTLVIHWALEWLAARRRCVTRVLLMGGVVCADFELWEDVAPAVRQEIVNVHSAKDRILFPLRVLGNPIGRNAIGSLFRKLRDVKIVLGHFDYWENLSYVLDRVWPERHRSRKYHPTVETVCPWCEEEIITTANEPLECPWCRVEATYQISDDSFHYDIRPKKILCRSCRSGTFWVQESGLYGCDKPGCRSWNEVKRIGSRVQFRTPR